MWAICYDELVVHTDVEGLDVLPASEDLWALDLEAAGGEGGRSYRTLRDMREAVDEDGAYDVMVIDCPPNLSAACVSAILASDAVIIPVLSDACSATGVADLMEQIDSLRLVENTNNSGQSAEELIRNEKCTAALDDSGTPTSLQSVSYSDTTWSLLFNCNSIFASTELRQALASAAVSAVEVPDGGLFAEAKGLIPDGLTVDGMNYRDTAGDVTPAAVDARALYLTARQTLTTSDFNKVSLMVPAGSGVTSAAEEINGVWQKEFSLFFSVEEVDEETFAKRLAEGDYTIALAPISAEGGSVYNMLNQFTAAGGGLTGYADSLYATQLQASAQATGSSRCRLLGDCERQLLSDAVAVPLFAQQKRLLIAPGIQNLIFDPFGPVLDLTYTTKE